MFCKKGVLRNFAKFTGKHLCFSLFFKNVADSACNFIKKETLVQLFSCEFCEIFSEHLVIEDLRWLLLVFIVNLSICLLGRQNQFKIGAKFHF